MPVSNAIYKQIMGEDNETDYYSRTQKEVENLKTRINSTGVSSEVSSPGPLISLLRLLVRPGAATLNAAREYTNPNAGPTPGVTDPGAAFKRGLTGEQTTFGKDIMKDLGASDKPWFTTSIGGIKIAPNTAGLLGTGFDLLNPTDPLNWILPGVGKVGAKAIPKGMTLVEKTLGRGPAEELSNKLGADWINKVGMIDKAGNPTVTTMGDLAKVLGKRATNMGIDNGVNPEAISDLILRVMKEKDLTAGSRLIDKPKYALNVGLNVPFMNKELGRVNIPGTQTIATAAARGGEKFMNTQLGQVLGKSFATPGSFTPNTVPGSVWTRMIRRGSPKTTLTTGGIMPDPTQLEIMSGKTAYQQIIKDAQSAAGKATNREQDFEAALNVALKGLNEEDRKELMKGLVNPEYQLKPHLTGAYTFLDNARKKMVEDYRALGIEFTPLENYVPFVTVGKPLTRDESALLQGVFGPKIQRVQGTDLAEVISKSADPHLVARTISALDPSEVNRVLGREWLTEDAGVAMARRGIKAIRGQEATTFLQGIMEKYGLTIGDLKRLNNLPEGYVVVVPRVDGSGRVMLDAVKEAKDTTAFALPKEFVTAYHDYTDMIYNPHAASGIMSFVDQFTRAYKTIAYMWTPGHIPRDFTSNAYNLWLGGMRDFTPLYDAGKLLKNVSKSGAGKNEWSELLEPEKLALENVSKKELEALGNELNVPELTQKGTIDINNNSTMLSYPQWQGTDIELYEAVRELGLTESSGVLNEFQQTGKDWSFTMGGGPLGKYTDVMRKATRLNDNMARIAGVIDQLKKGRTIEQAVAHTKKFLFDYNELTPFEKSVMKRVVPFYTWMRKNIPLQIEMILTHPGKYATTYKAMQGIGVPEDGTVPSFITQAGGLEVEGSDGKKKELLPSLPFSDISKLPTSTESARELMGSINPLFRAPFEMATNTALFSGQPLENYEGELTNIPFGKQLEQLGLLKEGSTPLIPKRTLGYLLNQIPPLRSLDIMTNPENARQGAKISSFMGGAQTYPEEWARMAATYESRDKLRALVRVLEDRGIEVPSVKELENLISDGPKTFNKRKLSETDKIILEALNLL